LTEVYDVITIGAVLIDMIALVDEFPEKDGEAFVREFQLAPGGAAANVATICSRLGLKTAFSGKIGNDHFGRLLQEDLLREGIHITETLKITELTTTGSCYICVDKNGERMILAYSGAADTMTIEDLPLELFSKARWVSLSDLRNVSAIEALLEENATEINFALNPGALIAQNPSRAYRLAQHADLIVASQNEFTEIFRCTEDEINDIASNFAQEKKGRVIAVTKGKEGAVLFCRKEKITIPSFNVPVKDTTGAGDAFAAGMLYGLIRQRDLKDVGRIAAACSAICIQEVGARSGPRNKRELLKFLRKN